MKDLLKEIAENSPLFESEYDGRMEYWCFFCGAYDEDGKCKHENNCLWLRIKKKVK